ncbi:hypothetical protein KJS94_11425 [Flavihumibacter rivuli]|uniref:hypothetical protein n=1 Tax=Flavihumibacter rivuli TaxID=2838156 RepID=UPI001BDF48A1|nr:hypothetical protein [Flavihumibacter rivuli]ULQ55252.1 hypothetical protein KJS94_11425 [Flavihumibacter rivuli]
MQKVLSRLAPVLLLLTVFSYSSCQKEDQDSSTSTEEKPGQIPGMGNDPRPPEGPLFTLPPGVSLIGNITGQDDGPTASDCVYDGQGTNVKVKMILQNDSIGAPATIEFPPGLVITAITDGFQNGLLMERIVVVLPPRQPGGNAPKCNVTLMLSCLNAQDKPSTESAIYTFGPVTSSSLINDFISKLSTKEILYSKFPPTDPDWNLNQEFIQDALWNLTDGKGLTNADLKHIQDLPNK